MVVVGATLAAFVMDQVDTWKAWTYNWQAIQKSHPAGVKYFCSIQVDSRGLAPFKPLVDRLNEIGADWWTWMLDDGRTAVSSANRLRHIAAGRNYVSDYACAVSDCTHVLFVDADIAPPADVLVKLLAMNYPFCSAFLPTYDLHGTPVATYPFPVEVGKTAGGLALLNRDVFRRLRWRWDMDDGLSDDFCLQRDAETWLGLPVHVRMDCQGMHYPMCIPAIENRGHDMKVER